MSETSTVSTIFFCLCGITWSIPNCSKIKKKKSEFTWKDFGHKRPSVTTVRIRAKIMASLTGGRIRDGGLIEKGGYFKFLTI